MSKIDVFGSAGKTPARLAEKGFTFYDALQAGAALNPELRQFLLGGEAPIVFTLGSAAPRKDYSGLRVAKELGELLDNPSYAAKAAEIGAILELENGVGAACDAIEQQLRVVTSRS